MDVRIKIKATVTDLTLAEKYNNSLKDGFFMSESGQRLPYERLASECEEVIEYTAIGSYVEDGEKVSITYTEPEDIGLDCVTTLVFDKSDRKVLTMVRSGELSAAFRFDMNERRQLCSYETPFMPVEFIANTRNVENSVSKKGGKILLDYCLEVRGINTERNRMFIEVRPV